MQSLADKIRAADNDRTVDKPSRVTPEQAEYILMAWDCHAGEPGGILIADHCMSGIRATYCEHLPNMAWGMVALETRTPLDPPTLRNPADLADALNAALDDCEGA